MSMLFTKPFWEDAAERAAKSGAQAAVLALGGDVIDAWHVDWMTVGGIALGGVALSLLTSIASIAVANRGTASLSKSVELTAPSE